MRNKFLVFGAPYIGEEEIREVVDTLRSGWWGTGPKTELFEDKLHRFVSFPFGASIILSARKS